MTSAKMAEQGLLKILSLMAMEQQQYQHKLRKQGSRCQSMCSEFWKRKTCTNSGSMQPRKPTTCWEEELCGSSCLAPSLALYFVARISLKINSLVTETPAASLKNYPHVLCLVLPWKAPLRSLIYLTSSLGRRKPFTQSVVF